MVMANVPPNLFDTNIFITRIKRILRHKYVTYGLRDTVNEFVFSKRHQLDPLFVIPPSHISRWHHVEEDSEIDSAVSEMDSDEERVSKTELDVWITDLITQLEAIFVLILSNHDAKEFAIGLANCSGLAAKARSRLRLL